MHRPLAIKESVGSRVFDAFNVLFMLLVGFVMLYPFYWVFITTISDPVYLSKHTVKLWPKGFHVDAYKYVLADDAIWRAYGNTIRYTVVGTLVSLSVTSLTAYVLSIRTYSLKRPLSLFFTVTLFLNGGMIPTYLMISNLKLINTIWAIALPPAMSLWYVVILRTGFGGVSEELREAALVDGANDLRIFLQIVLPLSKAALATIALFAAVGYWNNLFNALLYINEKNKFPLTIYLRNLIVTGENDPMSLASNESYLFFTNIVESGGAAGMGIAIKMSAIVFTILPIMCVYPFVQKYFVKGVMLGSVKG